MVFLIYAIALTGVFNSMTETLNNTQTWQHLGNVQPNLDYWTEFPIVATGGNDLVRVKFLYPADVNADGWIWLRCRYDLSSGILHSRSERVYTTNDLVGIELPIPTDLRERGLVNRVFEAKKGYKFRRYGRTTPPYNYSVSLEELLD